MYLILYVHHLPKQNEILRTFSNSIPVWKIDDRPLTNCKKLVHLWAHFSEFQLTILKWLGSLYNFLTIGIILQSFVTHLKLSSQKMKRKQNSISHGLAFSHPSALLTIFWRPIRSYAVLLLSHKKKIFNLNNSKKRFHILYGSKVSKQHIVKNDTSFRFYRVTI